MINIVFILQSTMSLKIILTRKNAFFNATESSLFGVIKYQIFFPDKNSRTNSSQKEVK